MIYPTSFEKKIDFLKIRELIKENCLSKLGKEKVDKMNFSSSFDLINKEINETDEFKTICLLDNTFPTVNYFDARNILLRLEVIGTYIQEFELFNLKRSLDTISSVLHFFDKKQDEEFPYLKKLSKNVLLHSFVLDRINSIITKTGRIKDNASRELSVIRQTLIKKQRSVSNILNSKLKEIQKNGWVETDLSLTMVNGRTVIPITASYKRKVAGFVHDVSASGKTAYIEPTEIVEINNEIVELEYSEKREIIHILKDVSEDIKPYINDLLLCYDFLGEVDFIRSKALFSISINAIKPAFINEQMISLFKARHPLLYLVLKKEQKEVVPLNIELDSQKRILLISGPNAGGKSVCLKTVGLIQYMFQCGILVPVGGVSEMGVFDNLFLDIGDEQSIENDLSTYSSHLLNMKYFLKNTNSKSLVFIDEFGTGTEPILGGAIAEAILKKLNKNKTFGVVTTHYSNLKQFAGDNDGIENGAMMYDANKLKPLFVLESGIPGNSFALEIARNIGLPEYILAEATEKVGQGYISFDKLLKETIRDKKYWENKRRKIRQNEKKLEETLEKYSSELINIEKEKKQILKDSKTKADSYLKDVNKKIENTIFQIKKANADKEKTKLLRKDFSDYKKKEELKEHTSDRQILNKIEKLKQREKQLKNKRQAESSENNKKEVVIKFEEEELKPGLKVKIKGRNIIGEIAEVNNKNAVVIFGEMITSIKKSELEVISKKEFNQNGKNYNQKSNISWTINNKTLNFSSNIDVRGKRVDEVMKLIIDYIDEAIVVDVNEIKILHGKGNGILRHSIREYLSTVKEIISYKDENIQFGGSGITIVKFK